MYRLVYSGALAEDQTREAVQSRVAQLFKKSPEDIDALFGGERRVLKQADSASALEPLRDALRKAGALAEIEAPQGASATAPARAPAAPAAPAPE